MKRSELDLARGGGTALWRQIAETLKRGIASGEHPAGQQLPTEHQMAEAFGVNRHTVRRAVSALAEEGLVRIEQGRGTFVQESVIDYAVGRRTRFSENLVRMNKEPAGRILRVEEISADAEVAKALEIRRGSAVVMVERLGEADGRPLSISSHYFAKARFPNLAAMVEEAGSVTAALRQSGISDYTRRVTRVTARTAQASESRLLQQPPNKPVLVTEGINVDAAGRPVEYSVARWAPDRVKIVFEGG